MLPRAEAQSAAGGLRAWACFGQQRCVSLNCPLESAISPLAGKPEINELLPSLRRGARAGLPYGSRKAGYRPTARSVARIGRLSAPPAALSRRRRDRTHDGYLRVH